jgi:hypothetical protein
MLAGGIMSPHKFAVGQIVKFLPDRYQSNLRDARFKVLRLLPEADHALQYRVKSQGDGHERIVREDQLARA